MIPTFTISCFLLWLLHSSQSAEGSEIVCPNHCACSQNPMKLSVAKCDHLPHINEIIDVGVLEIENHDSYTCPITEDLLKFTSLKNLRVSHCAANICSSSFKNLTNLQNLTLHNVSLHHFNPLLFESNNQLKILNLSSNPLKIWRHLLVSASIEEVDLSDCSLGEVPKNAFSQILNLKRLSLRNNSLKNLDVLLPITVTYLDLSNNQLDSIPVRALRRLGNMKELIISENPLICSCSLKLMDKYMSLKGIAFSRPEKCIAATNKQPIALDDISIEDICANIPNNEMQGVTTLSSHRNRRQASGELDQDEFGKANAEKLDDSAETISTTNKIPKAATTKRSTAGGGKKLTTNGVQRPSSDALTNADGESTTEAVEDGPKPLVEPIIFYLVFALLFLLLILIIVIIVSLCLALKNRCKDNSSAATTAAVKMCQGRSDETKKLMKKCASRKGSCRICPSTMRSNRNNCRSNVTTISRFDCGETATECSDNETVVNDCDYATTNASSSACTTFERR